MIWRRIGPLWFLHGTFLLWGAVFCFLVFQHLKKNAEEHFFQRVQVVLEEKAWFLKQTTSPKGLAQKSEEVVRFLAAFPSGRYAIFAQKGSDPLTLAGQVPPPEWEKPLGNAALSAESFAVHFPSEEKEYVESVFPLEDVDGTAWILRWGLWTSDLKEEHQRNGLSLFWTWIILGLAAILIPVLYSRRVRWVDHD